MNWRTLLLRCGRARRWAAALSGALPLLAAAASLDARGLARFDAGYARCEARYAHMKGARDEAYLAAYRLKADAESRARLAALRRSAEYRQEQRAVRAAASGPATAASSPLAHQCQALWAEVQRARSAAR
jgi:hypothetical protein